MQHLRNRLGLKLAVLALLVLPEMARAQFFTYTRYGDLMGGFRKTGAFQGNYELVVYFGNITNFVALKAGTTINITNYSKAQLGNAFPDNFANLQWSAFSTFPATGFPEQPWNTPVGSFPKATCWYTLARTNVSAQTLPPNRFSYNFQGNLRANVLGVSVGANRISTGLGVTNVNNNTVLVREPVADVSDILTAEIGDRTDPTFGDFGGTCLNFSIENTTPAPFSSPAVSDLYQSCPFGFPDPITGLTNGTAYALGYFTLNPDGTMTFTRGEGSVYVQPPPPSQVTVSVVGGGAGSISSPDTNIISFLTTNGATYKLYFTNSMGLTTPATNWPALTTTITGDGTVKSFLDIITTNVTDRFYRIGAH